METNQIPWGKINLSDQIFSHSFSENCQLNITRISGEVLIKIIEKGTETSKRIITGSEQTLFIEPALPDMPVILKPLQDISVLPMKKLEVFVEIPFFVKILFGTQNNKNTIHEFRTHLLSRSYFGSSEAGEFAYFVESPLYCSIADYKNPESSVYCPLTISNKSSQNLEFEKMILRVPYLSIYQHKQYLIASPVSITFRGQEQISQIVYKKNPPVSEGTPKLLAHPREKEDKNLLRRSFYYIKNLYTG